MAQSDPPRGGVVEAPYQGAARDARASAGFPEPPLELTQRVCADGYPEPVTAFGWLDRASRPAALCLLAGALFYNAVLASKEDRAEEAWGWIVVTGMLGLAGVKTVERVAPASRALGALAAR